MHSLSTTAVICYLITYKPFVSPLQNFKETFNEVLIAIAAYPLWMYSDWLYGDATRIYASWTMLGILCIVIVFNMSLMLGT